MKPTLLILAAGIGSRYGGMKQIDQVGPSGEAIIDYSIHDAIRAGFGKIVFVVRRSIEEEVRDFFMDKLTGKIEMDFVCQELNMVPPGVSYPPEREKPWGTAHAVWVAADTIKEPFLVINADDFYGRESFVKMVEYLTAESTVHNTKYCMIGYQVKHTLSDFGTVSRGICQADSNSFLKAVVERKEVWKKNSSFFYKNDEDKIVPLSGNELVSMNIWGFTPEIFKHFEKQFIDFIRINAANVKAELYIPTVINDVVHSGKGSVKILPSTGRLWFGITYKEDKPIAEKKIRELIKQGTYPDNLWA
jgi:NDP-sugar pyrophosphorylase family protein